MKIMFKRADLVDAGWDISESHDDNNSVLAQRDVETEDGKRTIRLYMPEVGGNLLYEPNLMNDEAYLDICLSRIKSTGVAYTVL